MTPGDVRRRPGPLRRLRGLGARGRLTFAANLAAVATWVALSMVGLMFALNDSMTSDSGLEGVGAAFAMIGLFPFALAAVLMSLVASSRAFPLGVAWCRGSEQPLVPGLSFAHMLLAWGMVAGLLLHEAVA